MTNEENAVDVSAAKDGGVLKTILKPGISASHPTKGDTVYVHYVGTLDDGSQFDSSRDRGEEFSFTLGRGQVIGAWDMAVATMTKGELCKIHCASKYAYGEAGSPPKIPPNADLNFEIELFRWEGEDISPDHDKSIMRSIQTEGAKPECPNEGAQLETHIAGYYDGRKFLDDNFEFLLGECTECGLPEGIDKALKRFRKGEKSSIHVGASWGYGKNGSEKYNIPPNVALDFEIELKNFEKSKDSWQMKIEEKLVEAEKLKARGTDFFQQGKNKLAIFKYQRIVDFLQNETNLEGEQKEKRDNLYRAAQLNLALVFLKTNDTADSIKHCEKVLEEDKNNVKALYRRAQAYQNQNDDKLAIADYEKVLTIETDNKAAQAQILVCKKKIAEITQKEKKLYANMFQINS
jgi:FK506-binding protein 4/5